MTFADAGIMILTNIWKTKRGDSMVTEEDLIKFIKEQKEFNEYVAAKLQQLEGGLR